MPHATKATYVVLSGSHSHGFTQQAEMRVSTTKSLPSYQRPRTTSKSIKEKLIHLFPAVLLLHLAFQLDSVSSLLLLATTTTTKRTTTMDEEDSSPNTTELYKPYRKHPDLFGNEFKEEWLHPTMIRLVKEFKQLEDNSKNDHDKKDDIVSRMTTSSSSSSSSSSGSDVLLKKEMDDVYSFDCFTTQFIQMFNEELHNFYHISEIHNIPVRRPNSSKLFVTSSFFLWLGVWLV